MTAKSLEGTESILPLDTFINEERDMQEHLRREKQKEEKQS